MIALALLATIPDAAALRARLARAPAAIRLFVDRRESCGHWEGEDPYDGPRGREISAALSELHCGSLGRDERELRARYRSRPDLLRLLDATRDGID